LPLPSLVYSQFLDDMWHSVPQSGELIAQIAFTIAAGSKGLLLFQDGIKQYHADPHTFEEAGAVLMSIQVLLPLKFSPQHPQIIAISH
jgi:hypothetical protein